MISGEARHPGRLNPGDIIHLERHRVGGVMVGRRELDVEVTATAWTDSLHRQVAVEWRSCPDFPGAQPGASGVSVYDRLGWVPFLWHRTAGAA